MKKIFTALLLMVLTVGTQAQKQYTYESIEGDPLKARIYTLDNGLKIYLTVNRNEPRIQTYIAVRTGSKNDPAETTGLAHYLEHILFKGTNSFGTNDYASERPLLDSIRSLYEVYRTKTDPQERAAIYHRIDSISGVASTFAIANEYDKPMARMHTPARTKPSIRRTSLPTKWRTGRLCRATASRTWWFAVSTPNSKPCMRNTTAD